MGDEWVTLEEAHPGPTPISVFASKEDRKEFGGQPPKPKRGLIWSGEHQQWLELKK